MPQTLDTIEDIQLIVHGQLLLFADLADAPRAESAPDDIPVPLWWFFVSGAALATTMLLPLLPIAAPTTPVIAIMSRSPTSPSDDANFLQVSAPPPLISTGDFPEQPVPNDASSPEEVVYFSPQPKTLLDRIAERRQKREKLQSLHAAAPSSPPSELPPLPRADNKVGVFLTAGSVAHENFLTDTIDDLTSAGGNALVFDVKGSRVLFHSAAPMANEADLVVPIVDLPDVLRFAKARGLYTIGRFVAIKDYGITERMPETRVRDPKNSDRVLSENRVDPANETAINYNMQIICELAAAGIDEINLDYIRFSTAEFGALRAYSGQEKADHLEKFLHATRETIDRCGPRTRLGINTFAILGWNYEQNLETLGQDVIRFAPLVDVISPMAYPASFAQGYYYRPGKDPGSRMYFLVYQTLKGYQDLLGPEQSKKLRPWIQGYGVTQKNMRDEITAVYDAGACGFTVWNANNAYGVTWSAMKNGPERPSRCLE